MSEFKGSMDGRTILITGAAGHLGGALAMALAKAGARLFLVDKDTVSLAKLEAALGEEGKHRAFEADLEDHSQRLRLISDIAGSTPVLDGLVHNAALVGTADLEGWAVPFPEQSVDTWRRALEVNVTAPFHLTQGLTPLMAKASAPSIVTVASVHAVVGPDWALYKGLPMASPAAYAASKAALIQLTRWLATTLAPHVRANSVSPGGLERAQPHEFLERYSAKTPLGRLGREADVVGAVMYLLSEAASYVTGQNIVVDGGYSSL